MPSTKEVHRQVCMAQGMTNEEIEKDWEICERELQDQHEQTIEEAMKEAPHAGRDHGSAQSLRS
jgi:hypothetical protein